MLYKKLLSGKEMPALGLGTWQSKPDELINAVTHAIKVGYRHFDTAYVYQNEGDVGKAFKECLDSGVVKREDLFVTSKLWNIYHHPHNVRKNCELTLKLLGLDYLDMYLIHWPMGYVDNGEIFPKDSNGHFLYSDVDYLDTWKAMEKLVEDRLVRHIGLSNFNKEQIKRIWENSTIKPSCLQVECHPYLQQNELIDITNALGMVFTGYAPFGSPERPWHQADDVKVLDDPVLQEIAKQCGKTTAQVILRYQLQRGLTVIPKSVTPERIEQNFQVFDFQLSDSQMEAIATLDRGLRMVVLGWISDHPHYPFK